MGQEARCVARHGDQASEGKAHLDTDELWFRGEFRVRIPYSQMSNVRTGDGWLEVSWPDGDASFQLGAQAERWARRILNPPSLLDKLGVKPGHNVSVLGIQDSAFLAQVHAQAACVVEGTAVPGSDLIFLAAESLADLERLAGLREWLTRDGGIWVVAPKGKQHIREADVLAAGKPAGLVDVKVARFSATHTAHKFVIPLAQR